MRLPKFNPYICGQMSLLFGLLAVIVVVIPFETHPYFRGSGAERLSNSEIGERVGRLDLYEMPLALIGLAFGLVALRREKPPFLPIVGVPLCVIVLCWTFVVIGFGYFAFAVMVVAILLCVLEPLFWLVDILRVFFTTSKKD